MSMTAATPTTDNTETRPTPTSSPHIMCKVRRTPRLMPRVIARVMHIPGVTETKKNVGIKSAKMAGSIQSDTLHLQGNKQTILPITLF
ncbi:hypothetical protein KAM344_20570 [Aeromonas caviae]|nr:hypothetical protein KAM344_20570 [Aeromonas caviae]